MFHARRLSAKDAAVYRELRLTALRNHPNAYASSAVDWAEKPTSFVRDTLEKRFIYGLFNGADLVGMTAYDREKSVKTRHRATLTAVYIRPDSRGHGGFQTLLNAIMAQAKLDQVIQLELLVEASNTAAITTYERASFIQNGTIARALLIGTDYFDEILMIKQLDQTG